MLGWALVTNYNTIDYFLLLKNKEGNYPGVGVITQWYHMDHTSPTENECGKHFNHIKQTNKQKQNNKGRMNKS